jgi:hypothetical protein
LFTPLFYYDPEDDHLDWQINWSNEQHQWIRLAINPKTNEVVKELSLNQTSREILYGHFNLSYHDKPPQWIDDKSPFDLRKIPSFNHPI